MTQKTLVKDDIAQAVYYAHGAFSQKEAAQTVDLLLDLMKKQIFEDEKLLVSGFGKFELVRRKSRRIADPNSGQHMILPDKWAIKFKPSQKLVKEVNKS
jgi:nucleoid DNA-binding protein